MNIVNRKILSIFVIFILLMVCCGVSFASDAVDESDYDNNLNDYIDLDDDSDDWDDDSDDSDYEDDWDDDSDQNLKYKKDLYYKPVLVWNNASSSGLSVNVIAANSNKNVASNALNEEKTVINNPIKSSVAKSISSNSYQNDVNVIESGDSSAINDNHAIESENAATEDNRNATKTDDNEVNNEPMIDFDWSSILLLLATLLLSLILII